MLSKVLPQYLELVLVILFSEENKFKSDQDLLINQDKQQIFVDGKRFVE